MTENDFVLEHYGGNQDNAVKSYQQLIDQSIASDDAGGHGESKESFEVLKEVNTPFIQSNICADSIGSILASCMNTEYWPGFDGDDEGVTLTGIGEDISHLISLISSDPQSLPEFPKEFHLPTGYAAHTLQHSLNEEGIDKNIEHYFEIMGLKLPKPTDSNEQVKRPSRSNRRRSTYASRRPSLESLSGDNGLMITPKSCKLKVHLPGVGDNIVIMTLHSNYDVEQQVDAFLVQYGIEEHTYARAKLLDTAKNAVDSINKGLLPTSPVDRVGIEKAPADTNSADTSLNHLPSVSLNDEQVKPPTLSLRQYKIKLKLPDSTLELLVKESEDLSALAKSITTSNQLDHEYEARILKQLMKLFV